MFSVFEHLRDLTFLSVTLRLIVSVLCGGLIGLEREFKRRSAGFRTHILICLGSAMTTMTSQYLVFSLHQYTDLGRLGSNVIAGIGFICAGTILVTHRQRVKGLTTAAGLWVTAIIGLAVGVGYFEAGIIVSLLILLIEIFLSKVEYVMASDPSEYTLYIEYAEKNGIRTILEYLSRYQIKVQNIVITKTGSTHEHVYCAIISVFLKKKIPFAKIIHEMLELSGIIAVERI